MCVCVCVCVYVCVCVCVCVETGGMFDLDVWNEREEREWKRDVRHVFPRFVYFLVLRVFCNARYLRFLVLSV